MKRLQLVLFLSPLLIGCAGEKTESKDEFDSSVKDFDPSTSADSDSGPDTRGGGITDSDTEGDATILSAYLGLLDANIVAAAALANVSGCLQKVNDEGMPVVFSIHLVADSVDPADFEVVTKQGVSHTPSCATLEPAVDLDENRTVLLTGAFGSVKDPPVRVTLVGELIAIDLEDGRLSTVTGLSSGPVIRAEQGPEIVLAVVFNQPVRSTCPAGRTRIQTTWSGGVTGPYGREFDDRDLELFSITVETPDGEQKIVKPDSFGDLDDGDNHLDLCFQAVDGTPLSIEVLAKTAFDPTNHPNPTQTIIIGPFE